MSQNTTMSRDIRLMSSTAAGNPYIISCTCSLIRDVKYERIYTRDLQKFDLLMTEEFLIKDGLVETGREMEDVSFYTTIPNLSGTCNLANYIVQE